MPALRAARRRWPDHHHVLVLPGPLGADALRWQLADEVVDLRPFAVPAGLRVDVALNLHGKGPQSTGALARLRPRRLVAFASAGAGHHDGPAWRADEHEVARWCRLLAWAGADPEPTDLLLAPSADAVGRERVVVLHPGAASAGRRWPARRFAAVAEALAAGGWDVVATAGPGEEDLARAALGNSGGRVLAGVPLADLETLLRRASLCVVGDTGVGHLAAACACPGVHLLGPVPPAQWGPPTDGRRVLLHHPRPGDPQDPHAGAPDPALLRITVDEVLAAARTLLPG